jgi:RimJ/RimL family protein N-acetyltransferase
MLAFRLLEPADFPLLFEWLQRPHVKQWWDDGENTLEKVELHYGPLSDEEDVERFILMWSPEDRQDLRPIGYFQWYLLPDGTGGIDQYIGEPDLVNRGIGTEAIRRFLAMLVERHDPPRIIIDPDPQNARAIRCYEKVGFRHYETVTREDGTQAYMMEIRR